MNLLVTGAAGFIGSRYVRTLLAADAPDAADAPRITVLDALTYAGTLDNLELDHPRLEFVHGDIRDADLVSKLTAEADQVVHFAAESHVDRSILTASDFVLTNVLGTQVLLDAALRHGVDTFVHVSTDEVYGSIASGSATEAYPLEPSAPYSASKASSDLLALAYHRTHGLDVRVTRCSNNYGPHQFPEKVIPLFVTNLLDGSEGSRCTATASTSATGCTSTTTAPASTSCGPGAGPARSTTSAAAPNSPTRTSPASSSKPAAPGGTGS
ncbi:GDP-mannose 4,6-dehydratase [Streptomyces hirsutus]